MLSVFAGKTIHSIAIKKPFLFSLNYFGSICNKSGCFGCLMDIKEDFGCQQIQIFSMYGFFTLTKAFQDPSTLFVAELKLDVIDVIVTIPFPLHISSHRCWLVVLVFYGPSTHFRSFRARSVNLATLFLGKPPGQFTNI